MMPGSVHDWLGRWGFGYLSTEWVDEYLRQWNKNTGLNINLDYLKEKHVYTDTAF